MKIQWPVSLRMTVCAVAVCAVSAVSAQTAPAQPEAPAVPATTMLPAPVVQQDSAAPAAPKAEHKHKHKHKAKKHHHKKHSHAKHQRGNYASPEAHEAAAARDEQRRGSGPYAPQAHPEMDRYQRNAMARCDVFKDRSDHQACVERVRQPGQGSVEGGGILREYTQQVVLPAAR